MTPALSYTELKALDPCTDSLRRVAKLMGGAAKWNGKRVNAADARKAGATFDDIVWAASAIARTNTDVDRRLRLWLADCAARVLHIYEREYPADDRVRNTIVASRQFARGEIGAAAWAAAGADARDSAWAAAWDAAGAAAWDAAGTTAGAAARAAAGTAARAAARAAAGTAARAAAWDAARAAAKATAWDAAWDAAGTTAGTTAWDAAWDAEGAWQFDRLIEWLGDKEPDDYALPSAPVKEKVA